MMTATELQQLAASYAGEAIRVLVQIAQDENCLLYTSDAADE